MPTLIQRLFSRSYRNAVAAEAAGEYIVAAENYALADMPCKVAEMHFIRSRRVNVADRADVLDDALRWLRKAENREDLSETFQQDLAVALFDEAKALPSGDPRRISLANSSATLHEEEGRLKEAGIAFEFAEKKEDALRCYEAVGHIEGMEKLLEEESESRSSSRAVRDSFDLFEDSLASGARDRAMIALRQCCTEAPGHGYERMLRDLEKKLPNPGSLDIRINGVRLIVVGASPAFIGRGDAHVPLRHPGISRKHAAIDSDETGYFLRDSGSRNGTLLSGIALSGRVPLSGSGIIGLGDRCTIQFSLVEGVVDLEVLDGPDRGLKAAVIKDQWTLGESPFSISFNGAQAVICSSHGHPLLLNEKRTSLPIVPLVGDIIDSGGGGRIEVLG